jgi:hypothetical protein
MGRKDVDIAPCGDVNVKTGRFVDSETFEGENFYGFWGNDTCYEVYRTTSGKIRVVATAGTKPVVKVGQSSSFRSYYSGRHLFRGEVIEVVVGDEGFRSLREKYGNKINVATYK